MNTMKCVGCGKTHWTNQPEEGWICVSCQQFMREMSEQKPLPKWARAQATEYASDITSYSADQHADRWHAFEAGVRAVLERIERTRETDRTIFALGEVYLNQGRESVRKEVLGE